MVAAARVLFALAGMALVVLVVRREGPERIADAVRRAPRCSAAGWGDLQGPRAQATAAPTASAAPSASASASAPVPTGPFPIDKDEQKLAPIDFEPYPVVTDKPVAPKPKEWVDARLVRFTRRGEQTPYCELRRVREWLRVTCGVQMAAVALIAGNPEGVTVWVKGGTEDGQAAGPAEAMFPMRPGDRRIFQFFDLEPGSWGSGFPKNGPVVQAYWLEGAPAPVVIAR